MINMPLNALGPYNAEAAPGNNSTLSISNSPIPEIDPRLALMVGSAVSMPSTI